MNSREIKIVLTVSTLVSSALLIIGIFVRGSIELPLQGMSYGLVFEMFKNPDFLGFHFKAFVWFFIASVISSSIAVKYVKRTG